jgi:LEA14-like dessication related protein
VQGVSYNLRLNGVSVARGEQAQTMNLPSQHPVLVDIPVRLQVGEILRLAPMVWRDRQANYQLDGAVRLPMLSVPFQRQGAIGVK